MLSVLGATVNDPERIRNEIVLLRVKLGHQHMDYSRDLLSHPKETEWFSDQENLMKSDWKC